MATIHTPIKGSIRERVGKKGTSYQITVDDTDLGRAGGRHTETFKSYADAEKRLAVLENGGRPTAKATVSAWLDYWLELARTDRKHPKRQRTIESYKNAIDNHISPVIGHLKLAKVRARNLQDLEDNSPLSSSAVGQIHSVLKGAFRLAAVEDLIPTNPMRDVQPPARPSKRIELPSVADVRAILDLAEAEGGELFAMVQTIAHTGTRRAELMGLRWEDVDLSTGRITINGQLLRTRELGLIYQPEPKTASGHRTITVDAKTIDVLRAHRDAQDATMERMGPAYENKGWVFADETGHERMPDTFYKWLISLAKRAGVQKVHPHSFRHFYGSLLTNSGESLADVSSTMGHANPGITQRLYVHSLPGESDHLAARFAGLVAVPILFGKRADQTGESLGDAPGSAIVTACPGRIRQEFGLQRVAFVFDYLPDGVLERVQFRAEACLHDYFLRCAWVRATRTYGVGQHEVNWGGDIEVRGPSILTVWRR